MFFFLTSVIYFIVFIITPGLGSIRKALKQQKYGRCDLLTSKQSLFLWTPVTYAWLMMRQIVRTSRMLCKKLYEEWRNCEMVQRPRLMTRQFICDSCGVFHGDCQINRYHSFKHFFDRKVDESICYTRLMALCFASIYFMFQWSIKNFIFKSIWHLIFTNLFVWGYFLILCIP